MNSIFRSTVRRRTCENFNTLLSFIYFPFSMLAHIPHLFFKPTDKNEILHLAMQGHFNEIFQLKL